MFKELLILLAVVVTVECRRDGEWNEGPGYPKSGQSYYPQNEPQLKPPVDPAYTGGRPSYNNYPSGPQYSDRHGLSPQKPLRHYDPYMKPHPRHHTTGQLKNSVMRGFNSLKNGAMKPAVGTALQLAAPVIHKTAQKAAPLYDKVVDWSKTRDARHQHPMAGLPSHPNYPPHNLPIEPMPQSSVRPPNYAPSKHY